MFSLRKKKIVIRIIKKNKKEIHIELEETEERRARLFIKKVSEYKKNFIYNNFDHD